MCEGGRECVQGSGEVDTASSQMHEKKVEGRRKQ